MAPDFDRQGSEHQGWAAGTRHAETAPGTVRLAVRRLDAVPLSGADSLGGAVLARARDIGRHGIRHKEGAVSGFEDHLRGRA